MEYERLKRADEMRDVLAGLARLRKDLGSEPVNRDGLTVKRF